MKNPDTAAESASVRHLSSALAGLKIDPLILQAVADVDRSLLAWSLSLSVRERLRACTKAAAAVVDLRSAHAGSN